MTCNLFYFKRKASFTQWFLIIQSGLNYSFENNLIICAFFEMELFQKKRNIFK